MDTDFWVINTSSGQYRVSEETILEVRAEVGRHVGVPHRENVELEFTDLAGSHCVVMLGSYFGFLESTKEQRAFDRRLNAALDKEKEDDTPSWQ